MPQIDEIALSLHVVGDDLVPREISVLLGALPETGYRKGDDLRRPNGRVVEARTGVWRRKVERRSPGDFDAQVEEVLAPLTTDLAIWRELSQRFDVYLFVGVFQRQWNSMMEISPTTALALGERGIRIDFDMYAEVVPEPDADDVTSM